MPYCVIAENPEEGAQAFDRINQHLRDTGPFPPEGQLLLIAGPGEPGWRAISVWDSEEAAQRFFTDRLRPVCERAGVDFGKVQRTVFEVHMLVAGDPAAARFGRGRDAASASSGRSPAAESVHPVG
jgi:hypothetical protein